MTLPPWGKWLLAHLSGVLWAGIAVAVLVWGYEERRAGKISAELNAAKDAQAKAEASAARWKAASVAWIVKAVAADAAFHVKQDSTARLAGRYLTQRDSVLAQLAASPATAPIATLLAPVLARCDSLAAAATDTMPCHARVAKRDSAIGALTAANAAKDSGLAAAEDRIRLLGKKDRWFLGLPRPKCVAGLGGVATATGHVSAGAGVLCGIPF